MEITPVNPFVQLPHMALDSLGGCPTLMYDPNLLTEQEKKIIIKTWKGDVAIDLESKRFERGRVIIVAVHDGEPHGDDIGLIALLRVLLRDFQIRWIRTRDSRKLATADIRADVGFGEFDHHGMRADRDHGVAAITRIYQLLLNTLGDAYPRIVWERFAEVCDRLAAADTGLIDFSYAPWINDAVAANRADPGWAAGGDGTDPTLDALFSRLVDRMTEWFEDVFRSGMAAHKATEKALEDIEKSGRDFIVFSPEARQAPCKELLWKQDHSAWYFISPAGKDHWVVNCTCDPEKPFSRKASWHLFPKRFWGMGEKELREIIDCPPGNDTFVHADGFVAGFPTLDAAIAFAKLCCEEGGWA